MLPQNYTLWIFEEPDLQRDPEYFMPFKAGLRLSN